MLKNRQTLYVVVNEHFAPAFCISPEGCVVKEVSLSLWRRRNLHAEPWKVTVVDTGLNTQTGGRVKRIKDYVGDEEFMLTYGDAVGDINIKEVLDFHHSHGKIGTMSMYNFGQNKGVVEVGKDGVIDAFREKSDTDGDLINIGFMVFKPELFDLIEGDTTVFEKGPLVKLVEKQELVGYIHTGSVCYWMKDWKITVITADNMDGSWHRLSLWRWYQATGASWLT